MRMSALLASQVLSENSNIMACYNLPLEEFQNCKNKMAASRKSSFFSRKVHKLKKMLRVLLNRDVLAPQSPEEIQNAINEALEMKLKKDIDSSAGIRGDSIQTIVDGTISLLTVQPGSTISLPVHFVCRAPGQFVWTFLPPPDNDICSRGDSTSITTSQNPQQQTPVLSSQE